MEEFLLPMIASALQTLACLIEEKPALAASVLRNAAAGMMGGEPGISSLFRAFGDVLPPSAPEPPGARDTVAPGADAAVIGLGLDKPEGFVSDPSPASAPALPFDGAPEPEPA